MIERVSERADLILIRHGEVADQWQGRCYGALDVPLSDRGEAQSRELAAQLARQVRPRAIYHSGLQRTRYLAERLAEAARAMTPARTVTPAGAAALPVIADERLQERYFGRWQGWSWQRAYDSDPVGFDGLIERPDTYRPPGGETTSELQRRVQEWFEQHVAGAPKAGPVIAISHSGPIAALAGALRRCHARDWHPWMLRPLQSLHVTLPNQVFRQPGS